ncbi:MAG: hypothetical protein IKI84_11735 [Clostridia bacterium]|nr:hypothetical protein [Clostridia bacterium]
MHQMPTRNVRIWTAASVVSAVLGALGMLLWSGLAFPGLILGALAVGAFSSGRAGAGDSKTAKAARLAAALGICLSLPVILALIVRATR